MRLPRGLLGGFFGALGVLPLVPIAAGVARRYGSIPELPGIGRTLRDVKAATYAEAVVLLVVVPLTALLFGRLLPRFLESRVRTGALSFEWVAVGFASSLWLARSGVRPKHALLAGLAAAGTAAWGIAAFRSSLSVRRMASRRGRRAAASLFLAGASLDLARRAGLSTGPHLIPDIVTEVALAGLVVVVIAALVSLTFSRRPERSFRRAGSAAWVAIAFAAAGVAFPHRALLFGAAGLVVLAVLALVEKPPFPRTAERISLTTMLLVCGWKIQSPFVLSLFDLFEDGHSLYGTQAYLHGARPYVDMEPIHGWGSDGGMDALWFRAFGDTLREFELRHAIWATGAFVLLAAWSLAALRSRFFGALAFLFALAFTYVTIERQALAFASLACLAWGLSRKRPGLVVLSGTLAACELLHSLDYGLIVSIGTLGGLFCLAALDWRDGAPARAALRDPARFLGGFLFGALPFLILLAVRHSLGAFLRTSFIEIPRWVSQVWDKPAGNAWETLVKARSPADFVRILSGDGMPALFLLLLLGVAGAVLLLRAAARRLDPVDRFALIAFVVAVVAMRVVLGRADQPHIDRYGLFVGAPAAWLLLRAARSPRARALLFFATAGFLLTRLHPLQTLGWELGQVEKASRLNRDAVAAEPPRSGGARLAASTAAGLSAFRNYVDAHLDPGETFFDFSNQPALYFFSDRVPPIRYPTVAQYESSSRQQEVIAALERLEPPLAVLATDPYGALDGVPNSERAPAVARYIAENYEGGELVGGRRVARRRGVSTR